MKTTLDLNQVVAKYIKCKCVMCGSTYKEGDWYHNRRALMLCLRCEHRDGLIHFKGLRSRWFFDYESIDRLLTRQVSQLSAAIMALEREARREN